MGELITLTAADGHGLPGWASGHDGPGLVVLQEIFGLNRHIRRTADRFAAEGFTVVAPALFHRVAPGLELGYTEADVARGREIRAQVALDDALGDIAAAVDALRTQGLNVGVVGYCWGGSLTWAAATRLDGIAASVGYYGGDVAKMADERPRCPVMLHFGEQDHAIPLSDVAIVRQKHPELAVYTYPAGHGFSCDERASFHPESHARALGRTLPFLRRHLGG
jgi:carboxymethylenebutenolidase